MGKLNDRVTLVANVSVVVGIVFLALQMRQNTLAIQAQTRDAITEKQMTWAGWIATNRETAQIFVQASQGETFDADPAAATMLGFLIGGQMREFENSHYQFERGLFTPDEYEARALRWRRTMGNPAYRAYWETNREVYAPSFRAEIDRIVAEVGGR